MPEDVEPGGSDEVDLRPEQADLLARVRSYLERELSTRVTLSEREISIEALHNYSVGSVIVLKDLDPQRLQLEVDGVPIAEGQTVRVGDRLALRIEKVVAPREILDRLQMTDRPTPEAGPEESGSVPDEGPRLD